MVTVFALLAFASRQTVDLNAGWEFARIPSPPSIWNGLDAVPTALWRVKSVSSQETRGEDAPATKAFDGKPATFWHTEWNERQAPYPHSITIDLGSPTEAVGLRLLPRQTGPQNGRPKHFRLLIDEKPVSLGSVPDDASLYQLRFPATKGRTLRLIFEDGHRPESFLAIAEIGLIRATKQGNDWSSQYNVANVKVGGSERTLEELERLRQAETKAIKAWQPATLPHAAWVRPLDDSEIWQGVAYYRRQLPTPPKGRRAILELHGMQSVDAWLNGKHIAERRGGYLPLRTEIKEGGNLLVRVDNRDNPLIPPGKPQAELDFMYGAGLVGNARLTITDPLHIEGASWIDPPSFGRGNASTWVHTLVRNDGATQRTFVLRQALLDTNGKKVADKTRLFTLPPKGEQLFGHQISVYLPRLWSPERPNLYRLRTTVEDDGRVIDAEESKVGLRTIAVSREKGLLLNGQPLRLVGTNRHQDYPWVGPALSDAANRRDALLIKRSGHNIVRLSHYNQSPAFLDACDELGILIIPCIPGWQFTNADPRFKARVLRDIRETVRRDLRHPSVAFWEASLNETYPSAELAKSWYDAAHAAGAEIVAGDETPGAPWDVVYNGWREDLSRPQSTPKPGYIREYGDYEFGGGASTSRVRIREGLDKLLNETWNHVWSYNKFRPQYPATMGAGTWEMFDHNVPWNFAVSASGLADLMRREKPSFWFFASQEAKKPYLKLAADWQPGPQKRRIVVFTNAPSATLYINGVPIAKAAAPRGPATPYDLKNAFNDTDGANLPHPPIVFRAVPFTPGELKAVGSSGAEATIQTAGKPTRLKVWLDDLGVPPTRNDLVFVRAAVVDANGTICHGESRKITFEGATFAGERVVACEMGVASVLVRTPTKGAAIRVQARVGGLEGAGIFEVR